MWCHIAFILGKFKLAFRNSKHIQIECKDILSYESEFEGGGVYVPCTNVHRPTGMRSWHGHRVLSKFGRGPTGRKFTYIFFGSFAVSVYRWVAGSQNFEDLQDMKWYRHRSYVKIFSCIGLRLPNSRVSSGGGGGVYAGAAPGCLLRGGGGGQNVSLLLREPKNFAQPWKSRSAGGGGTPTPFFSTSKICPNFFHNGDDRPLSWQAKKMGLRI